MEDEGFPVNTKRDQRPESMKSVIGLAVTHHAPGQEVVGNLGLTDDH